MTNYKYQISNKLFNYKLINLEFDIYLDFGIWILTFNAGSNRFR